MPRISEVGRQTLEIVSEMQSRESPVEIVPRLRAPAELTAEEAIEFRRIVDCMPADWFNAGNLALLTQYARHVITARRIAESVDAAMKEARGEGLDDLLRAQARETRMILQTMTALRLTPRAVEPRSVSVKKLAQAPSPWAGWKREQAARPRSPAPAARPREADPSS
jgi:hypothetical protein